MVKASHSKGVLPMKNAIALLAFVLMGSAAMASENDLLFREGPEKGTSALTGTMIGVYEMCFTGNAFAVRNKALAVMSEDIEKDAYFVRVDKKRNQLLISYVETKCLDDSTDATPEGCRTWFSVPACK
jgi:hypothetical protein